MTLSGHIPKSIRKNEDIESYTNSKFIFKLDLMYTYVNHILYVSDGCVSPGEHSFSA